MTIRHLMKKLALIGCILLSLPLWTSAEELGVCIVNPADGQAFEVGSQVFVEATVQQEQESKVAVLFRVNGEPLGEPDEEFPYQSQFWQVPGPGVYRVDAVLVDEEGNPLASDSVTIYGTPVPSHVATHYDPLGSNQDFLDQIYVDLLDREPKNAELTDYLEKLEYGMMSRAEVIDAICKTQEFQDLLTTQSAYQAIIGEWPSPHEFSEMLANFKDSDGGEIPESSDDVGNTFESALSIPATTVFSGVLGGYSDVDMFRFHLEEETVVKLSTTGAFDTTASLYDGEGNLLASDDDSGTFFSFALEQTLPPGDYYLGVSGWAGTEGIYNLCFQFGDTNPILPFETPVELERMIHTLYHSQVSIQRNGHPEDFVQSESARNLLFSQLYTSRYGRGPTLAQIQEGVDNLLKAGSVESFTAAFMQNSAPEQSLISNQPDLRDRDEAAYLIRALLKVRPTRNRINWLLGMSLREKTKVLLEDPFYVARFKTQEKSLLIASDLASGATPEYQSRNPFSFSFSSNSELPQTDDNPFASLEQSNNGWKYLDWFGWFSDRDYPWLYHENLGWIEVKPLNTQEMWLWHNRFEWAYTGEDSYPYLYRYADKHWIRLDYEDQPGEFEIVEPDTGSAGP